MVSAQPSSVLRHTPRPRSRSPIRVLALDLIGTIPYDHRITNLALHRRALYEAHPESATAAAFKHIAIQSDKWPTPTAASGKLEFFVERLIQSGQAAGAGRK